MKRANIYELSLLRGDIGILLTLKIGKIEYVCCNYRLQININNFTVERN